MASQGVETLRHQSWSTEDGLPQNSVHGIAQTSDGYLWVGTEAGLGRFDGVQFEVFTRRTEPALHSDDICCLLADSDNGLWIGTRDGLVHRTPVGSRWYGSKDGLPSTAIVGLSRDEHGSLLVETAAGPFHGPAVAGRPGQSADDAWSWYANQVRVQGTAGGSSAMWRTGVELPGGRISMLEVDRSGEAWVGMTSGLVAIDPSTGAVHRIAALSGASVLSIFEDAQGNHWIGTETSGLHILRRQLFRNIAALQDSPTTAIARAEDGAVWVGTRENGLYRVRDGVVDQPVASRSLTSAVILCLQAAPDGSLWVGTPDGLNQINSDKVVRRLTTVQGLPDDYIRSLAVERDGSVWVGTRHGLDHIQSGQHHVFTTMDGLGGDLIGALLVDRGNIVWAATSGGLSRIGQDGSIRTFTAADGLASPIVSALALDEERHLWIATRDGMMFTLAGDRLRAMFNVQPSGSMDRTVQSIFFDSQQSLWVQMDRGIERIRPVEIAHCLAHSPCELPSEGVVRYGRADGLLVDESVATAISSPALMPHGELWFATRAGVAIADTSSLRTPGSTPPIVIERAAVDDTDLDLKQRTLEIAYGAWRLTVEYAGLDFVAPAGVRYRVRLDGFDRDWQSVGNRRSITYTNLAPGAYTFRVQARTNDGDWGAAEATLHVKVLPPFYRRWWFAALVFLLAVLALLSLYLLRLRVLRQRFDAVLAERNRMAREIHDTLTQDFVSTCLQLDIVAQQLGRGQVEQALGQVHGARRFVTEGLAEARESLRELRSNQARETLPNKLAHLAAREVFGAIRPRVETQGAYWPLSPRSDREVLRIASEALMNVLRHAQATEAVMSLQYSPENLIVTVEDNGIGFDPEVASDQAGHFGLIGMKERASIVDGKLEIVSGRGKGTVVRLQVPASSRAEEGDAR